MSYFTRMEMEKTDEEKIQFIIDKWKNKDFKGSFSGYSNFSSQLKAEGYHFPESLIRTALHRIPVILMTEARKRPKETRSYLDIGGVGALGQCDVMLMPTYAGKIGALIVIDCFSNYVFGQSLPNKKKSSITSGFNKILRKSPPFSVMSGDGEFRYLEKYFSKKGSKLSIKQRGFHATKVEGAIRTLKRRLFTRMRMRKTENWPNFLQWSIRSLNSSFQESLAGLRPKDIMKKDPIEGDAVLAAAFKAKNMVPKTTNSKERQRKLSKDFIAKKGNEKFLPGKPVMLDFPNEGPFRTQKEHYIKRASPYLIRDVNFTQDIPMFQLQTVRNVPIHGFYYKENLHPMESPKTLKRFFPTYKIIDQRIKKKKEFRFDVLIEEKDGTKHWEKIQDLFYKKNQKS